MATHAYYWTLVADTDLAMATARGLHSVAAEARERAAQIRAASRHVVAESRRTRADSSSRRAIRQRYAFGGPGLRTADPGTVSGGRDHLPLDHHGSGTSRAAEATRPRPGHRLD